MSGQTQLIIFVKAPRPGTVKTRIAAELGVAEACAAYRQLVNQLVFRLRQQNCVQLCYSPDDALTEITPWLQSRWTSKPQGDGDLGERILNAFESSAASGFSRTLVIGSDCPYLTPEDIREAAAALDQNDVVLGPAPDGGYWLIGLKTPQPELFKGITWSTGEVLKQTMDRTNELGLRVRLLRKLSDIDTQEDWNAYLAHSRGSRR